MVKADESWLFQQHSAWHSPNLNYTSKPLPPGQRNSFPSFMNPCTFSTNVAFPGFKTAQANGTHELSQNLPPLVESSVSPRNPYSIESQYESPLGLGIKIMPNDATASVQKRFLIFDQSGSQTRLFFSPFDSSSRIPFLAHAKQEVNPVLLDEKQTTISPTKPFTRERSGENQVIGEESVMHEDTEEINALLYSDDDDENDDEDDDGDEDDEVTSTGHSPCAIKGSHQKFEQWEITEEVASSDGSSKRQKLLDGGYEKSSLVEAKSSMKLDRSCEYKDDAASSCAMGSISGKKDKIEETLRIIQSIIPGSMSKDPLLIIDEAIDYLKSLKLKAQSQSSLC